MASSNVLLGVCDGPCSELILSPYENKIGGYPDFFPGSSLSSLPHCTNCGGFLRLLAQIYCPLEGSVDHRLLHIYCCSVPECHQRNEGWLALRSEYPDPSLTNSTDSSLTLANAHSASASSCTTALSATTGVCDQDGWCVGADDWGEEVRSTVLPETKEEGFWQGQRDGVSLRSGLSLSGLSHCEEPGCFDTAKTDVEDVTLNMDSLQLTDTRTVTESTQAASLPSLTGPHFKPLYLNVVSDPSSLSSDADLHRAERLLERYVEENQQTHCFDVELTARKGKRRNPSNPPAGGRGGDQSGWAEKYEKVVVKHGDVTFQKFKKALSRCPAQVLRYSWNGEPLLISNKQQTLQHGEIMCKSCGAPAVFEFQLMPPLVYVLQQNEKQMEAVTEDPVSSIEFGTVLIFSCSQSCWGNKNGFHEERVFVVADPEGEILNDQF